MSSAVLCDPSYMHDFRLVFLDLCQKDLRGIYNNAVRHTIVLMPIVVSDRTARPPHDAERENCPRRVPRAEPGNLRGRGWPHPVPRRDDPPHGPFSSATNARTREVTATRTVAHVARMLDRAIASRR